MNQDRPEILLVGTGAVGSFYGGMLSRAGARVSALCRSDYETVKERGISIQSALGNFTFHPETVIRDAGEYGSKPDYIIVATKVLPEIDTPSIIKKAVHPGTAIILLQNGIDIEKSVVSAFPDNEVISGLAFICVTRTAPGVIDHQDYGRIVVGKYPEGASPKADMICSLLQKSGVNCETDSSITTARWKKLLWNAPFNPISVLAGGADTKAMMDSKATLVLIENIMKEVSLLARVTGSPLPDNAIKKNLDDTSVMKPYKTSMLLDYENRRPMEVEAILGNAVRIAQKQGISVPHIESLYGLLVLADAQNRAPRAV